MKLAKWMVGGALALLPVFLARTRLRKATVRAMDTERATIKVNMAMMIGTKTAATITGMTRKFTTGTTLAATIFPGLAKKDRLPPGLEKQLVRRGTLLPGWKRRFILARPSWFATSLRRRPIVRTS